MNPSLAIRLQVWHVLFRCSQSCIAWSIKPLTHAQETCTGNLYRKLARVLIAPKFSKHHFSNYQFVIFARLPEDTPAHQGLRFHIDLSLGRLASQSRVRYHVQAALGTGGLTNSAGTTVHLLLTSGDGMWTLGRRRIHVSYDFMIYTVSHKKRDTFSFVITLANIDRFS